MSQSVMNCAFVSTNDENLRIKSPLGQEILCENQESKHTFEDKFVETKVFKSDGNFFDAESFSKLEKYSNSFSSSEFTFNSEADLQINVDDASDDLFIERNHQKDVVLTNYTKPPFSFIDSFDIQIAKCEDSVMRHESFQFNVNLSRVNVLKNFLLSPFCKKLRWESNRFDIHNIVIVAKYNRGIAPQLIDIDSIQQCMIVKKCESHKSICIKLKMRGGDCYFINFKSEYERRQWITILKLRKDIIDYTYKLKNTQNRKEFIHLLENFVATCILFSKRKNETIQPYSELISNILDVVDCNVYRTNGI
ncbi:hypothetical protein A3Q56_07976 [Intoshia linei]|uniref:C-Maf-inducing protein PH domain-containing protein n=1 Tax=Intoshia linei TaxID=1819745 RepID=A0A177AS04_9BILA|nr:hypothetical protein A3Q56_07976 [Intoshia linei]